MYKTKSISFFHKATNRMSNNTKSKVTYFQSNKINFVPRQLTYRFLEESFPLFSLLPAPRFVELCFPEPYSLGNICKTKNNIFRLCLWEQETNYYYYINYTSTILNE